MNEAEQIAARIQAILPNLKAGTLRFWGEWFGRPHDNIHQVAACDAKDGILHVQFDQGEHLYLWSPHQAVLDQREFRIQSASRVRWEWFAYGRPKAEDSRYYMDFARINERIEAQTNVDWYTPSLRPTSQAPAVEIV